MPGTACTRVRETLSFLSSSHLLVIDDPRFTSLFLFSSDRITRKYHGSVAHAMADRIQPINAIAPEWKNVLFFFPSLSNNRDASSFAAFAAERNLWARGGMRCSEGSEQSHAFILRSSAKRAVRLRRKIISCPLVRRDASPPFVSESRAIA